MLFNKYKSLFRIAFSFFLKDRIRSLSTILGIAIGIFLILILFGLAEGLKSSVIQEFEKFGRDIIFVVPGSFSSSAFGVFSMNEYKEIKGLPNIKSITYMIFKRARIEYKDKTINSVVYGVNGDVIFKQYEGVMRLKEGRFFTSERGKEVVLGYNFIDIYFDKLKVGDYVYINGEKFRVVGILDKMGNEFSNTDDDAVYIPIKEARSLFENISIKDEVDFLIVEVYDESLIDKTADLIKERISKRRDEDSFRVITLNYILERTNEVISLIYVGIFFLTSFSLIIGGLGIMNTLFASIAEKRKQIGLLRVLGATKKEVLFIFLSESAIMGFFGALFAIAFSYLISTALAYFEVPYSLNIFSYILFSIFGMVIGVLGGLIPAYTALEVSPLEAIRNG